MDSFEKVFMMLQAMLLVIFIMVIVVFGAAIYKDAKCYEDPGLSECVQSTK